MAIWWASGDAIFSSFVVGRSCYTVSTMTMIFWFLRVSRAPFPVRYVFVVQRVHGDAIVPVFLWRRLCEVMLIWVAAMCRLAVWFLLCKTPQLLVYFIY